MYICIYVLTRFYLLPKRIRYIFRIFILGGLLWNIATRSELLSLTTWRCSPTWRKSTLGEFERWVFPPVGSLPKTDSRGQKPLKIGLFTPQKETKKSSNDPFSRAMRLIMLVQGGYCFFFSLNLLDEATRWKVSSVFFGPPKNHGSLEMVGWQPKIGSVMRCMWQNVATYCAFNLFCPFFSKHEWNTPKHQNGT